MVQLGLCQVRYLLPVHGWVDACDAFANVINLDTCNCSCASHKHTVHTHLCIFFGNALTLPRTALSHFSAHILTLCCRHPPQPQLQTPSPLPPQTPSMPSSPTRANRKLGGRCPNRPHNCQPPAHPPWTLSKPRLASS